MQIASIINALRSIFEPHRILFEANHIGQPVLLLALFEKGRLRPDIIRLLEVAKSCGVYIIAVNSKRLIAPADHESLIDCYIERYNFGRDFGSYKRGFLHIFGRGIERKAPRIIMANDSVFYSSRGLLDFLSLMNTTDVEALGATENHEIHNHLGSFWISLGQNVTQNKRFRRYWRRLALSDVRPLVILRGEMGLSKCIRRCVTDISQMRSHFNSSRFLEDLQNEEIFELAIKSARTSLTDWKRLDWTRLADTFMRLYTLDPLRHAPGSVEFELGQWQSKRLSLVNSLEDFTTFLKEESSDADRLDIELVRRFVIAQLGEIYISGSQVHQNAPVLLAMGLPFIKLDGLYRGMFSIQDVETLCSLVPSAEATALRRELMSRPYGGDTLFGWRRLAFFRGLL